MRRICIVLLCLLAGTMALAQPNFLTFHGDPQRTGWISTETVLTPANVSSGNFGSLWNSQPFDTVTIGSTTYAPHLYASPLYVDSVTISSGAFSGKTFSVVFAATSNGFVYAVNAFTTTGANPVAVGTILWSTKLGNPAVVGSLDGGVPVGVLATPVLDISRTPGHLYVASADASNGWQVFGLDITSGSILPGWPLNINNSTLAPINQNGPTIFQATTAMSQRGALNLSPDGSLLYVPFGAYGDGGAGWMVAVNTNTPVLASAFAGAPSSVQFANGGMWASGGAAVDATGNVFVTTGNGTTANEPTPGYWGQSLLKWAPGTPLALAGTYTPWNYCPMETADIDLAGGAPILLPDLGSANTSTPHLIAFGGKQGNAYLVDHDHMPGSLVMRQGCSTDSSSDKSLLPPGSQPQFGKPGPLNVFGPHSDTLSNTDFAKSRSTPAFYRAADGTNFVFMTGSTKVNANSTTTIPPCIARMKIMTSPGQPAFFAVDQFENTLTLLTPGSPTVTSNGSSNAIVWVQVANVLRSQSLIGSGVPHPILYALDAMTLKVLWSSTPAQLNVGGKYNAPAIARGTVFVGTDRIQAFGLGATPPPTVIQINAGGGAAGTFVADTDFVGGHPDTFTNAVDVSGVTNPAPQAVYQSKRTGNPPSTGFTYTIPGLMASASYKVRLHFVESAATAKGKRLFNVAINGTTVLASFDIFATAGKEFKAVVKEFTAVANSSGQIVVAWTYGSAGNPLASGIEVLH
jgi:hypothetical protein